MPLLEQQCDVPPNPIDGRDHLGGPDDGGDIGDIPPILSPVEIRVGWRTAFLPRRLIRRTPPLVHHLLWQAIRHSTTGKPA